VLESLQRPNNNSAKYKDPGKSNCVIAQNVMNDKAAAFIRKEADTGGDHVTRIPANQLCLPKSFPSTTILKTYTLHTLEVTRLASEHIHSTLKSSASTLLTKPSRH
jgi:hypothetical protein